jgi:hypothetical protein
MITNDQIAQGAITETKLSKNLRLSHSNIAAVQAGQVLVGNDSGDLSAATMSGDVTISSTGATTLTDASVLDVVKRLNVLRKQDFSQNNTMLFASYAGQPRAVNINELKILLGIPSTFNSSESEAAFVGTAGGGGGLVKIKSFTETVGANPFVIDGFSDTYDSYKLVCHDVMSTGSSTSDLGMRMVYGTTVISTDSYRYQEDVTGNDLEIWHTTANGTQYGFSTICIEDDESGAFDYNLYNFRNTAANGVFVVGHGISYHNFSSADVINSYRFFGGMRWAGGIATASRKVDAIYLYPLTSAAVEAAGASKIKGKFTLYGYQK